MPSMPSTFRSHGRPSRQEQRVAYDAKRREESPWRNWYKLKVWTVIRREQLTAHPLCARCQTLGNVTPATVCNHVEPHRGDWAKFIGGPFESLCKSHHDREVQAEEARARQPHPPGG